MSLAVLAAAGTLALAACTSGPGINRPVVAETAAETSAKSPGAASDSARWLNFLDDLESRPLVAHDDVLASALMLGTGRGGGSFDERVSAASRLGYVDLGYNKPAREASTVSEVAETLVRVARKSRTVTAEEAMSDLVGRGALPPSARSFQGITGAQLVSMLGSARDEMVAMGVKPSPWPSAEPAPGPARAAAEPAAPAKGDAEARERVSVTRIGFKGRPEPLPDVPLIGEKPTSAGAATTPPAPVTAPATIPPKAAQTPPAAPPSAPRATPMSAAPGVAPTPPSAPATVPGGPAPGVHPAPFSTTPASPAATSPKSAAPAAPAPPSPQKESAPKPRAEPGWVPAKPLRSGDGGKAGAGSN